MIVRVKVSVSVKPPELAVIVMRGVPVETSRSGENSRVAVPLRLSVNVA